ncbi:uncharacterized protein J8A68_000497 [[Candida] subhashii]|uniref:Acyl-CoA thioesterase II n=1 Tax=[Candida] subhashii TaxID=561895 RepID=A0A8J5QRY1_9ASCO|nr:uncharacterized protein J8A68_000497 [[Candida] subhashii]KAG7665874.1 hypothetical protein J8A68_000497 [[Candida] subhashii]
MIQNFVTDAVFPQNVTHDVQEIYGLKQISSHTYRGNLPLQKPMKKARGAYGGNLVAQAVAVAIKSSPHGFRPHSLHSYFVKAVNDQDVVDYDVEEISNGKSFVNRAIKAKQNGQVVYTANISLTKNNSHLEAWKRYNEAKANNHPNAEQLKPFEFSTPPHDWFDKYEIEKLPIGAANANLLFYHKVFPELVDLELTKHEEKIPIAERKFSYMVKWGIENEQGFNQPLTNVDPDFKYVGLASLSDSIFLTRLMRVLRIEGVDHTDLVHYFSVSLDHSLFFHDDDFDVTKWMGVTFKVSRCGHNRVLIEGKIYNHKKIHVATFVQEGLVQFGGREEGAKL